MIRTILWILLMTVAAIVVDVVLLVGFDLDSHTTAYIVTGLMLVAIFTRQAVLTRRKVQSWQDDAAAGPQEWPHTPEGR